MRLKLDLDEPTANRLIEVAQRERRPVAWQAEVLLQQALRPEGAQPAASPTLGPAEQGVGDA
ncbi:MAG: hypothetical protein HY689_00350 [Chloroflexi bacterium]|nr:hypothetical protein [Chloroflexota bacterium]